MVGTMDHRAGRRRGYPRTIYAGALRPMEIARPGPGTLQPMEIARPGPGKADSILVPSVGIYIKYIHIIMMT